MAGTDKSGLLSGGGSAPVWNLRVPPRIIGTLACQGGSPTLALWPLPGGITPVCSQNSVMSWNQ